MFTVCMNLYRTSMGTLCYLWNDSLGRRGVRHFLPLPAPTRSSPIPLTAPHMPHCHKHNTSMLAGLTLTNRLTAYVVQLCTTIVDNSSYFYFIIYIISGSVHVKWLRSCFFECY
ncbi:hypothetical protein J6590_017772 [Homalodisca vitripennis]|nr:hypothetical protein J6590_083463 [Homalodisca vitripennis]KAG8249859.1 hypothetical protein J6590_012170 [Homalodisca vitripennis]KAG8249861.1 hypothetical protein J6590_012172 [Homalodisca vitripennis]KAG8276469.1 hypothetical protein J6590_065214 [Homalodisca vitripennis]KAG8284987.1 hypothetical protein J6590_090853 [Homalodisca vitripennis]